MEEKGTGVYEYFQTEGIKGTPKEVAKRLRNIGIKKHKSGKKHKTQPKSKRGRKQDKEFVMIENTLKSLCNNLSLEPMTVYEWLNFLSVPQEIRTLELNRPQEEQQQTIIARLSTMEDDTELQKLTYLKS